MTAHLVAQQRALPQRALRPRGADHARRRPPSPAPTAALLRRRDVADPLAASLAAAVRARGSKPMLQRVYAGLEYTEDSAQLYSFPGQAGRPATAPHAVPNIGAATVSVFHVPKSSAHAELGPYRNTDHELLRDGRVKLTNDVRSAEWVIEGHAGGNLDAATMLGNMSADIDKVFRLRDDLIDAIHDARAGHPNDYVILAPGVMANLASPVPEGLFYYRPQEDGGKAQITIQYQKADTIRRIAELNASKYLMGKKVAEGDDARTVADARPRFRKAPWQRSTSSFHTAHSGLTPWLIANSVAISVTGGAAPDLYAAEVGVIKLMIINDAMASAMSRHKAIIGQAEDKNIQRFFPKSQRQNYVHAVAGTILPKSVLKALRRQVTANAAAMAQAVWDRVDPAALETAKSFASLFATDSAAAIRATDTRRRLITGQSTSATLRNEIKDAVLGANGARLAKWIARATLAYTDTSQDHSGHERAGARGNVIRSTLGYTPVAGGQGAVYELRERELPMSGRTKRPVLDALRLLLGVAD